MLTVPYALIETWFSVGDIASLHLFSKSPSLLSLLEPHHWFPLASCIFNLLSLWAPSHRIIIISHLNIPLSLPTHPPHLFLSFPSCPPPTPSSLLFLSLPALGAYRSTDIALDTVNDSTTTFLLLNLEDSLNHFTDFLTTLVITDPSFFLYLLDLNSLNSLCGDHIVSGFS